MKEYRGHPLEVPRPRFIFANNSEVLEPGVSAFVVEVYQCRNLEMLLLFSWDGLLTIVGGSKDTTRIRPKILLVFQCKRKSVNGCMFNIPSILLNIILTKLQYKIEIM